MIRTALLGSNLLEVDYVPRSQGRGWKKVIRPYGMIYGHRHYLIADVSTTEIPNYKSLALPGFQEIRVLDKTFVRNASFNIEDYAKESFGLFHERPFDVVWIFSKESAYAAKDFIFHPDQQATALADGRLKVSFRAGGLHEMAAYLCNWGKHVKVESPPELQELMKTHHDQWNFIP